MLLLATPAAAAFAAPIALSTLALVLLIAGGVVLLFFVGGVLAVRMRARRQERAFGEHVAAADEALQVARAADRGWDRARIEEAALEALAGARPEFACDALHLVLVDDRPGKGEDRAHLVAVGDRGRARIVMGRRGDGWVAESVD
jgi:hypothetical protein